MTDSQDEYSAAVLAVPDFLGRSQCRELIDRGEEHGIWRPALVEDTGQARAYEDEAANSAAILRNNDLWSDVTAESAPRILDLITKKWQFRDLVIRRLGLSKYEMGARVGRHRDTNYDETRRIVTCVIYLNEDFEGGRLIFPELDVAIEPTAGMLVLFLSELIHETEVADTRSRYCLVGFAETQLAG